MIQGIIDNETKETAGLDTNEDNDDLISKMTNMSICATETNEEGDKVSDNESETKDDVLVSSNPVFREDVPSTKILTVMEEIKKLRRLHEEDKSKAIQKAVVVSQWTSMLNVVKVHLKKMDVKIAEINGM